MGALLPSCVVPRPLWRAARRLHAGAAAGAGHAHAHGHGPDQTYRRPRHNGTAVCAPFDVPSAYSVPSVPSLHSLGATSPPRLASVPCLGDTQPWQQAAAKAAMVLVPVGYECAPFQLHQGRHPTAAPQETVLSPGSGRFLVVVLHGRVRLQRQDAFKFELGAGDACLAPCGWRLLSSPGQGFKVVVCAVISDAKADADADADTSSSGTHHRFFSNARGA